MTTEAATDLGIAQALSAGSLPGSVHVLAATARPLQESADLGGLLHAFRRSGARLSLLCLTRGEGAARSGGTGNAGPGNVSTENASTGRLEAARPWEVQMAASILGIGQVTVGSYRDGALHRHQTSELAERIERAIIECSAGLVLVVAPETGDIADAAVARAATAAALLARVPVAARTRPGVSGAWTVDLGADAEMARAIQKSAAAAHTSQADALPALIERLDRLGRTETVRWLLSPARVPAQRFGDARAGGGLAESPRPRSE
jgi:N-acetylglucosamine malate deacetylase 2